MWNLDSPNMWKTIQGLNGTPDINSSNKTMSHDGQTITSIKSKVNVFIHHYARVVNLPCLHVDWDLNRQFKKRQNARSADDEICAPLQMGELLSVIKKIKCKGAAGLDNILPSFLKSLGPLALQDLLSIFNSFFSLAHCPSIWRVATVVPLLKAGKSPSEVASFCFISRNTFVKLLEHILADSFYYIVEPKTYSADSKPVFVKVEVARITAIGKYKQ